MLGRVRGVLVERVGLRRGVLLSRSGAFYEVWLRGAATARIGAEAEGVVLPRAVTWARRRVGSWPRAAVATAVAFGAAGAVMAALYLRPAALPASPTGPGLPGEAVAGAEPAPGPVPGAASGVHRPLARPTGFAHRLEAPKLSVSWQPSEWASLTLREEAPWPPASEPSALWTLRRPLSVRLGATLRSQASAETDPSRGGGDGLAKSPGAADLPEAFGEGQGAGGRGGAPPAGARRAAVAAAVGAREQPEASRMEGTSGGPGGGAAASSQLAGPAAHRLEQQLLPPGP